MKGINGNMKGKEWPGHELCKTRLNLSTFIFQLEEREKLPVYMRGISMIELERQKQEAQKAIQLHESLTNAVNNSFIHKTKDFNKPIQKPAFL